MLSSNWFKFEHDIFVILLRHKIKNIFYIYLKNKRLFKEKIHFQVYKL